MASRASRMPAAAFDLCFRPWMRRRLILRAAGLAARLPGDRPVILAANHVSWWDGFVLRELHRRLGRTRVLNTVMSLRQLTRHPFLRHLGAIGMEESSPASILATLRGLRSGTGKRSEADVAFFPQGRIWPSYRRPLGVRRGVEVFARRLDAVVVPVALHVEPLTSRRFTFFASIGEPLTDDRSLGAIEHALTAEVDALLAFLALHGEAAAAEWPGPRGPLRQPTGVA